VIRCLVLIDGEHYPSVIETAVAALRSEGYVAVGAMFLGGTEKAGGLDLGIPVEAGDTEARLVELIARHQADLVFDLSDEPVLDHRQRFRLVGAALRAGVAYAGGGFRFDPPLRPVLTELPSVAISATGKRTGKTAVSIELARHWRAVGRRVCIVTMGRGGPPEPVVLHAGELEPPVAGLQGLARRGLHAASDYVEDALLAGVDTVGTFRCGAGPSGRTVSDNFSLGVNAAIELDPDVLIFEGSGSALPPAAAGASVLVIPSDLDPEYLRGYFGPYRLALGDAVVVTGGVDSGPEAAGISSIIAKIEPELSVFAARYTPEPTVSVAGRSVLVATTAPPEAGEEIVNALMAMEAGRVVTFHNLADRTALAEDLDAVARPDLVLVEVKAAAVDTVLPWADARGIEAGLLHNRVQLPGGIQELAIVLEERWGATLRG